MAFSCEVHPHVWRHRSDPSVIGAGSIVAGQDKPGLGSGREKSQEADVARGTTSGVYRRFV